ncbi:MAG: methylenetetrahydrofolate reductase C-terminal domain-containing protein, partial [Desulfobacteraceae bacterium]|nr:methylenetetrahydrofolate reductase C-terminal domain-containing protein [Desulfobacteraceae bacterium]
DLAQTLAFAREAAADGRLQAVSITENAGGHPALSPEVLGLECRALGLDVIIHLSCKDKNRNQLESLLYAWDRQELNNLLVITGDYPQRGYAGAPKPVFDLGSVQVLDLLSRMNRGVREGEPGRPGVELPPTSFLKGVAVSPFKTLESEQLMQYAKLHRKRAAGADFVITQLGFDARKFEELLLIMREQGLSMPVLGNVFIPNQALIEHLRAGRIPGCILPDSLYERMRREAAEPDRGKGARLERAAMLLAVLQGLGYAGAHLGGPGLTFADVDRVLTRMKVLASDWRALVPELSFWPKNAFFCYERDEATGLNRPERTPLAAPRPAPLYALARKAHDLAFSEEGPLYEPLRRLCAAVEDGRLEAAFASGEHLLKGLLFHCRNCGDCTLAELAFLCPQAGCAKFLLNGPCGGSRDGWCEVYPGQRRCLYVRMYERLRGRSPDELPAGFVPPRDWSLDQTSSWLNFFLDRDHAAKKKDCPA